MYPSAFDYIAPDTLDDALSLLHEYGDGAKILAGGQSLIPLLKLRFAAPTLVIDLGRIPGLNTVEERDGMLCIGAMARHADLADNPLVAARFPLMASAAPQIADPLVRNLGTVGGSLAHADPAGDWGSVLLALDAQVVVRGPKGQRVIAMDDFFQGIMTTALAADELLLEVRVPVPKSRSGGTYLKLERKVGDFATVGVAVQLELHGNEIQRAGIGLTAVGPRNIKASEAEAVLRHAAPEPAVFARAAELAAAATEPNTDVRGSAEYKRHVARVFVERGLNKALELARQ